MSLEDIWSAESGQETWWNASPEISEKFKETAKKAAAWAARTQRDEKKAKRYDFFLSSFLVKMILDKKYDSVLEKAIPLLNEWYPSNFILSVLSIAYEPISLKMREVLTSKPLHNFELVPKETLTQFSDFEIDEPIKLRINIWIEDIIDAISIDNSSVVTKKLQDFSTFDENMKQFISEALIFFLFHLNYTITKEKSLSFASFIVTEVKKILNATKIEEI